MCVLRIHASPQSHATLCADASWDGVEGSLCKHPLLPRGDFQRKSVGTFALPLLSRLRIEALFTNGGQRQKTRPSGGPTDEEMRGATVSGSVMKLAGSPFRDEKQPWEIDLE